MYKMPTEIEEIFDSHRQRELAERELAENMQYWITMTQVNQVWDRVRARPNKYRSSRVGVCIVDTGYDYNEAKRRNRPIQRSPSEALKALNIDAAIEIMDEALAIAPNFNLAQISKDALLSQKTTQ